MARREKGCVGRLAEGSTPFVAAAKGSFSASAKLSVAPADDEDGVINAFLSSVCVAAGTASTVTEFFLEDDDARTECAECDCDEPEPEEGLCASDGSPSGAVDTGAVAEDRLTDDEVWLLR